MAEGGRDPRSNVDDDTPTSSLPRSSSVNQRKLIEIINNNTLQETASGIREDFKNDILHEPDFEVCPQMKKVNVDDYYRGRFRYQNSPDAKTRSRFRNKGFQSQLIGKVGLYRQNENEGILITMEDIMASILKFEKSLPNDKVGYTAIVAPAGSGKTTLIRRIARKALSTSSAKKTNVFHRIARSVLAISSAKEKAEGAPSEPALKRKMIHYIELKNMKKEPYIKASKFLFGGLFNSESEEDEAFEWLVEHQYEAIIIFDGLDQVKWDFEESASRKIETFQKASTSIIIYNILSRNILPHVKTIVASREFKVSELPEEARPEEIITLEGLTPQEACKLFTFLVGENGTYIWKKIESISALLLQLISVPVILILVAFVMGTDHAITPPSTMTELNSLIISVVQSMQNIRNPRQIVSIINKLKGMAFHGMEYGRVVFDETDLKQFGVSADEVEDLMTKVPGNKIFSRQLTEGNVTFFFCLRSMQEFLAACFVSDMKLNEFSRFDHMHLHKQRWSVVRKFVTGIVYMRSPSDINLVSDQAKKQQILARSLRSQLGKPEYKHVRMELYTAICESGDDNHMTQYSAIDLYDIPLSRNEAHIVGSLVARNECLACLDLEDCSINDELLSIIARCLTERIQVMKVDLRGNNFSVSAVRSLLGHRKIESLSGKLDWKVVKLGVGDWDFELMNEDDVIKISDAADGHFNIKDSTLSFSRVLLFAVVEFCEKLFDAGFVKVIEDLLVKQDDLRKISVCELHKITKILLDCTEEENIEWPLIEAFSAKYQIDLVDIAVKDRITASDYNIMSERGRANSFFVNISVMFYVGEGTNFGKIVEACRQKKIEHIRCIFDFQCRPSLEEVSSLVDNCNLKKVTLIYLGDMLEGDELKEAKKIANDLDTELEVSKLLRGVKDSWEQLDYGFYDRSMDRRSTDSDAVLPLVIRDDHFALD